MKRILFIPLLLFILAGCSQNNKDTLKFYGNVDVRTVSLAFQVSGKLKTINFDEGQKIKKGELIATLDDALYKEYLNQIDAQIAVQKAKIAKLDKGYRIEEIQKAQATLKDKKVLMDNAKIVLKRNTKLLITKATSQDTYDHVKTTYESAKAQYMYAKSNVNLLKDGYEKEDIAAAKAQLNVLFAQKNERQLNLDYTSLYAPTDGTLLTRVHEVGSIINASSVVVTMTQEDQYWIRSYLSEKYLGNIKPGMKAKIYTDSGSQYEGVVSFISPLAEFTPKSVQTEDLRTDLVYRFRIILNNHDDKIKQGMPVTIEFPKLQ